MEQHQEKLFSSPVEAQPIPLRLPHPLLSINSSEGSGVITEPGQSQSPAPAQAQEASPRSRSRQLLLARVGEAACKLSPGTLPGRAVTVSAAHTLGKGSRHCGAVSPVPSHCSGSGGAPFLQLPRWRRGGTLQPGGAWGLARRVAQDTPSPRPPHPSLNCRISTGPGWAGRFMAGPASLHLTRGRPGLQTLN